MHHREEGDPGWLVGRNGTAPTHCQERIEAKLGSVRWLAKHAIYEVEGCPACDIYLWPAGMFLHHVRNILKALLKRAPFPPTSRRRRHRPSPGPVPSSSEEMTNSPTVALPSADVFGSTGGTVVLRNAFHEFDALQGFVLEKAIRPPTRLANSDPPRVYPGLQHGTRQRLSFVAVVDAQAIDGFSKASTLNEHFITDEAQRVPDELVGGEAMALNRSR